MSITATYNRSPTGNERFTNELIELELNERTERTKLNNDKFKILNHWSIRQI